MAKITLFAQVIQKLPKEIVKSLAKKHGTDKYAKGAVKLHTLLNFSTMLSEYVHITDGKAGDNTAARNVKVKPGTDKYARDSIHGVTL